jgi:hypothetical protein
MLIVTHLVKKFPAFHGTRRFIALFTWTLIPTQNLTQYFFMIHFNIIFSSTPVFPKRRLPLGFKVKVNLSLRFNGAQRHEGVLGSGGIAPRIL